MVSVNRLRDVIIVVSLGMWVSGCVFWFTVPADSSTTRDQLRAATVEVVPPPGHDDDHVEEVHEEVPSDHWAAERQQLAAERMAALAEARRRRRRAAAANAKANASSSSSSGSGSGSQQGSGHAVASLALPPHQQQQQQQQQQQKGEHNAAKIGASAAPRPLHAIQQQQHGSSSTSGSSGSAGSSSHDDAKQKHVASSSATHVTASSSSSSSLSHHEGDPSTRPAPRAHVAGKLHISKPTHPTAHVVTYGTSRGRVKKGRLIFHDVLRHVIPFECSREEKVIAYAQPTYATDQQKRLATSRTPRGGCRASKSWAGTAWVDVNGDGQLEYINNHHYGKCFRHGANEVAARERRGLKTGCASNYGWALGKRRDSAVRPVFEWAEQLLHFTDPVTKGRTDSDVYSQWDCHGMVVADIDGDGLQDIYCQATISTMSIAWEKDAYNKGVKAAGMRQEGDYNGVLWGTKIIPESIAKQHMGDKKRSRRAKDRAAAEAETEEWEQATAFQFRGGRQEAKAAGLVAPDYEDRDGVHRLHMHGHGDAPELAEYVQEVMDASTSYYKKRNVVAFDANLDGILDFYLCHTVAWVGGMYGSSLLMSKPPAAPGKRPTWHSAHDGVMNDFTITAFVADLDNDGWAREMVMHRELLPPCILANGKPLTSRSHRIRERGWRDLLAAFPMAWHDYCTKTHPSNSLGMYKFANDGTPTPLAPEASAKLVLRTLVRDFASVDVDGDGLNDVIFVSAEGLFAFPSKLRRHGEAPSRTTLVGLDSFRRGGADGVEVATVVTLDADLDGLEEILVIGVRPGTNRLYRPHVAAPGQVSYHLDSAGTAGLSGAAEGSESLVGIPLTVKGATVVDFNNDGFPDVHLAVDGPDQLLENGYGAALAQRGATQRPHYIALRLVGRGSNRDGVGATVVLKARRVLAHTHGAPPTIPEHAESVHVREVRRGARDRGFDDPRIVFGLGVAGQVESIMVRWPDGHEQRVVGEFTMDNIDNPFVVREVVAGAEGGVEVGEGGEAGPGEAAAAGEKEVKG